MKTVLLPEPIAEEAIELMKGRVEVIQANDPFEETLLPLMARANGVILRTRARMTRALIEAAPQLEVIARTGTGVDNVDVQAATERGIPICHNPSVNTVSVAEQVMAFLLALAKQLPSLDREVRKGNFRIRYAYLPVELEGKLLGLVGFGKIAREVAAKAIAAFRMKVHAFDPYVDKRHIVDAGVVPENSLEGLFSKADVISIHVPLTDQTRGMIGLQLLQRMKRSAFLINTSRGGVILEKDLVRVLAQKKILGAGLDVFGQEPLEADNPLCKLDNVLLTPHSSALTKECVVRMAEEAVRQTLDVLEGRPPAHVFNREALEKRRGGSNERI